jgi:hypothetical protein
MPSQVPSSVPTVSGNTGAPSSVPTISKGTAAPSAAPVGTSAPTPAKVATGTPTSAPAAGTAIPTAAAPVPAPPASCDSLGAIYDECAAANYAGNQTRTDCLNCVAAAFPSAGSECALFSSGICTALVTCDCEPCEAQLEVYTECLLAQAGVFCDLNCTLTPPSPTTPLVTSAPAAAPTATTTAPATTAPAPTSTTAAPSAAATSDAPSDMPSSVPSAAVAPAAPTAAVAPTAAAPAPGAPTAVTTPTPPASCTDIAAAYDTCAAANFADGQKSECENCLVGNIPTTGSGCDSFVPAVCAAIFTTCTACAPCAAELVGNTECRFAQAGLPCTFDCAV